MSSVEFQPILVDTASDDREGRLILSGETLVGVVVRLQGQEQGPLRGHWSLEAAFGPLAAALAHPFADLTEVETWVSKTIASFDARAQAASGRSANPIDGSAFSRAPSEPPASR